MVIFCEAISTFNFDDLHNLGEFVASIEPSTGHSEAAVRLYDLCAAFYQVAKVYFAESAASTSASSPNSNPPLMSQDQIQTGNSQAADQGGVPLPLEDFSMASGGMFFGTMPEPDAYMSWLAEDWFLPDQYMMGILDPNFGANQ